MSIDYTPQELSEIAGTIKKQVGVWALAEVGARDFRCGNITLAGMEKMPGLLFTAKPRHRLVDVYILLDPSDTYRVIVRKRNVHTTETLYDLEQVYWDMLPEIIRNLPKEV